MSSPNHNEPNRPKGRKKVVMEKIENETNLQVTFSKRRGGLFKKASELCTRTGAEASVVVFSPSGKAHSFGHPNVNTVADRFLNPDMDLQPANPIQDPNHQYLAHVESQIEIEKMRKKELDKERKALEKEKWVPSEENIEGLNYEQLENLKGAFVNFGNKLETHVARFPFGATAVIPYFDQGVNGAGEADMSNNHPNVHQ